MRNRTLTKVLDKIFWFIILLLPLIVYIFGNMAIGSVGDFQYADQNLESLVSVFYNHFGYDANGIVYTIAEWLSYNLDYTLGDLTLNQTLIAYGLYMLQVEILHFMIDILLFIFKWARKLLDGVLV